MAIVQNPQMVQCQRCGGKIKLSTKSSYDPFHWQKHRERCLRRSDVLVKELKENSDQVTQIIPSCFVPVDSQETMPVIVPDRSQDLYVVEKAGD